MFGLEHPMHGMVLNSGPRAVGAMGPEQEHYERLAYTTLVARASSKSLRYLHSTRQALSLVPGCSRRERKGGAFRTDAAEWSGPS
jgi:hypothetical protein